MVPIAHIKSCFNTKFGIPRQAGIVDTPATVVFTPPYRIMEAVRGLEGFDYIWLIWQFSKSERQEWTPTVRPPRLGGNQRMGVFATRSPFRPNPIGLSSVKLTRIEQHPSLGGHLLSNMPCGKAQPMSTLGRLIKLTSDFSWYLRV